MKALVTGGAGFIGSNLVRQLSAHGHQVTVLDNLLSGHIDNLRSCTEVRTVIADVRDEAAVKTVMRDVQVVFHLAASVGNKRSIDRPVADAEINVIGTLHVLEAARRAGVRKVVCSSSAGIFGELKDLPIVEQHPVEPDSPYGATKLCQEKLCLAYSKLYRLDAICLRYFNVYGRNQRYDAYGNVIPIFVSRILQRKPLTVYGDGTQTRDFINVRDVVQANLCAAHTDISGVFNIGSGTSISINNLIARLERVTGILPHVVHAPPRPGDVHDSLASITAAQTHLQFQPRVTIDEGLAEYVTWARANDVPLPA